MIKKRNIRLVLFLIWFSSLTFNLQSQDVVITINQPESGIIEHIASEKINMNPGYSYSPNPMFPGFFSMHAYIDPFQTYSVNYLANPLDAENRPLDYSLPVGSIPGTPSVSNTGAANYSIPIEVPPGTNGMQPNLSVVYNSQGGNGILGLNWKLGGLSAISRVPKNVYHDNEVEGIQFTSLDKFALDGNRLVKIGNSMYGGNLTQYHTEIETFSEITSFTVNITTGPEHFEVVTKNGSTIEYGNTTDSRIEAQGESQVLYWLMNKVTDPFGNVMEYFYIEDNSNGEYRIDRIEYTKNPAEGISSHYNKVQFYYDERDDESVAFNKGLEIWNKKVLRRINTYCEGDLAYSYKFNYHFNDYTHLVEVEKIASDNKHVNSTVFEWGEETVSVQAIPYDYGVLPGRKIYADFNGDGKVDLFNQPYVSGAPGGNWSLYELDGQVYSSMASGNNLMTGLPTNMISGDLNGDGLLDLVFGCISPYFVSFEIFINNSNGFTKYNSDYFNISTDSPYYRIGDFDGDGKDEILLAYDGSPSTNLIIFKIASFSPYTEVILESTFIEWENDIFVEDFNGNGKDDILYLNLSSKIIEYDGSSFGEITPTGGISYPTMSHDVFTGDFNGDGNCDILSYANSSWNVSLCDGTGFSSLVNQPDITNSSYNTANPWDNNYFIADFNGDGKADIYEGIMDGLNAHYKNVYYFNGTDWSTESEHYNYLAPEVTAYYFAEFNGDGNTDILTYNYNIGDLEILSFHPFEDKNRIRHISNGVDVQTNFVYKPLIDDEVYSKGSGAVFPLVDIIEPIWVVQQMITDNSVGGQNTIQYNYEGAKLHKQGRGFLGFSKVVKTNIASEIIQTSNYLVSTSKYYPYLKSTKTEFNIVTPDLISETIINDIEFKEFNTVFNCNSFLPLVKETETNDHIKEISSIITATFDNYANRLTKNKLSLNGTSQEWQDIITYSNYSSYGSLYPNKPGTVIKTKNNLAVSGESTTQINYTYHINNGSVVSAINNPQNQLQLSTLFQYNGFGNLINKTNIAVGIDNRVNSYIYDDKGRFAIESTNAENQTSTAEFDSKNGNVLSSTDPNSNTIISEYSSLGKMTKQISPTGQESTYSTDWYNSGTMSNVLYYTTTTIDGNGTSQEYFDKAGQVLRQKTPGFNGQVLVDFVYNDIGQLIQQSLPYFDGSSPDWMTVLYNDWGSIETEVSIMSNYSYSYNGLSVTKTDNNLSASTTKIYDAGGNVIQVNDISSNEIDYSYNNKGLPEEVTINGDPASTVSMDYDILGNQISLDDPDAGIMQYSYNAYGEIVSQIDANTNEYMFTYDKLGRKSLRWIPGGEITTYSYDNSTNGIGMISGITYSNGSSTNYTYDGYSRLSSISDIIDGVTFMKGFTYNSYNQLVNETYPSGLSINNVYDSNGFLEQIQKLNGITVWECVEINQFGKVEEFNLGNGFTTINDYDNFGYLSSIETLDQSLINTQDMYYSFSPLTGNLETRADLRKSVNEYFGYDLSNTKLTSSQVDANIPSIYDYDSHGNITYKSDAGNYTYDQSKIHSVTGITGNQGTIPSLNQYITYTDFSKVSTIFEAGKLLEFTYGHDRMRWKTQKFDNQILKETKYFLGSYEKVINEVTGAYKEFNYLSSPSGIYAVLTKEAGQIDQLHYIHTDHLGSIQSVSNENGSLTSEHSFDAWGRQRNPDYWNFYNVPDLPDFNRGFTGHEHLPDFGLVNMNGRLYDPVLGRMLSSDQYVSDSWNSQDYNRYSYVLNNPLKYTDPSGEFLIPALVSGWLLFTDSGYEAQKYLSPVAVHVDVDLFSSEQKGIGIDASVGIPKALPVSFRAHVGATFYWQYYDDSYKGWETRYGGEWTFGGIVSYSGTTFNSGGTSQTTNMITIGDPNINFKYENDYMFGVGEYLPGVPAADGGDRYRTAAARLNLGPFKAGVNMFTGDPGLNPDMRETFFDWNNNGRETYKTSNGNNPNKYRSGVFYVGFGPLEIGRNSEKIRNTFQNKFAHDFMMGGESPYFLWLDRDPSWYFYLGSGSGNTLW